MTSRPPLRLLWIENDYGELKVGIKHVADLLKEQLDRTIEIIPVPTN